MSARELPLDPSIRKARQPAPETFDCRVAFADELIAMARVDPRIVAVCNDSVGSSNLNGFQKEFPDRLVNVGIAEQNMVGVGAGLANAGFIPFVCAAGPFLTGRATEQIKADCAYSQYPVILCGMSPGMAYGELGPTHHSIEDFAWMRAIADLTIVVPVDPTETRQAVRWAAAAGRPIYMRVARFKIPSVSDGTVGFEAGRIATLRNGNDVTIAAIGTMVSRALDAADLLGQEGISVRVLNVLDFEAAGRGDGLGGGSGDWAHRDGGRGRFGRRSRRRHRGAGVAAPSRPDADPRRTELRADRRHTVPPQSFRAQRLRTRQGRARAFAPGRAVMGGPLVLGIDQGTSSTKCLLVDASGAVVSRGQAAVEETHPQPGWVEQDGGAIWASVQAAVADCVSAERAASVVAVGLSTQRESCIAWERA